MTVVVAFVRDKSLIGDAIGYFGGGFWAHMTNYVSDTEVIDARSGWTGKIPPGVQRRPASYLDENQYLLKVALPATPSMRAAWLTALEHQLDKPYDTTGILDFLTGRLADPNWRQKRSWFCDALGLYALEQARIIQPVVGLIDRLTPGAACNICCATEGAKIIAYRGQLVADFIKAAGLPLPQAA